MAARMEMERLGLGRLERLDLRSFWGEQLPDLTPWFVQNVDLLGQTLGIDITPMQRDHNQLGELIMHASTLESAVIVWVSPRFDLESRRTLEWLNDRTDSKVDFFGVELGLVRIGRSLPAPVLDVVVQPRNWRKASRRQGSLGGVSTSPGPVPMSPASVPTAPPPPPPPEPAPPPPPPAAAVSHIPAVPPPLASEKDGGLQPAEVRHSFFQAMFESVARRRPGFRVPKFGYEN